MHDLPFDDYGVNAMGAQLTIGGSCWRHVPADEGNVYSFSYWSIQWSGALGIQPIWKRVVTVAPMGPLTGFHLWGGY